MTRSLLVVDVGTSSVRSSIVRPDSSVTDTFQRSVVPRSPGPGLVELDAVAIARAALETAAAALDAGGPSSIGGVGIATQRASAVVWDRTSGAPLGPALGWQDLRTVLQCLILQGEGLRLAPNQTATKLQAILDEVDPDRQRMAAGELCCGTIDAFIAWHLSGGTAFVTDATHAGVSGLVLGSAVDYDDHVLEVLKIDRESLPRIVDSVGAVGTARALGYDLPICGIAGDQQASLVGQGCTLPGMAKITFGTGGMLDLVTGSQRPAAPIRGDAGTFPIVAFQQGGEITWGVEAIMLSAGSCVEWLQDDLGIISSPAETEVLAASCTDSGGATFIPALLGLGTPVWDFGARGTLLGLTRGTGKAQVCRAVLEGIAHRGADLVDAATADSGLELGALRVDGGMSANAVFLQSLADLSGRVVEVSPVLEATTLGAGYLAGLAIGTWSNIEALAEVTTPRARIEPHLDEAARLERRGCWLEDRAKAERTIPDLSGVSF